MLSSYNIDRDIAAYRRLIEDWDIVQLAERYDMLVQLGNLFVIEPENIDSLITEGYLAKIEPCLLRPYLIVCNQLFFFLLNIIVIYKEITLITLICIIIIFKNNH